MGERYSFEGVEIHEGTLERGTGFCFFFRRCNRRGISFFFERNRGTTTRVIGTQGKKADVAKSSGPLLNIITVGFGFSWMNEPEYVT